MIGLDIVQRKIHMYEEALNDTCDTKLAVTYQLHLDLLYSIRDEIKATYGLNDENEEESWTN